MGIWNGMDDDDIDLHREELVLIDQQIQQDREAEDAAEEGMT